VSAIAPPPALGAAATREVAVERPKADAKLVAAAREFEAVFVRQLLKSAHLDGKGGDSGYGAMAVDALAQAVTSGQGVGLARQISDALAEAMAKNDAENAPDARNPDVDAP
jgi:Rod binding domain-containing protein